MLAQKCFRKKNLFQTDEWETLSDSLSAQNFFKSDHSDKRFFSQKNHNDKEDFFADWTFDIKRLGHNNLDRLLKKTILI